MEATSTLKLVKKFKVLIFDIDGVLWNKKGAIQQSIEVLNDLLELREQKIYFMTNNSLRTRKEIIMRFESLGLKFKL